MVEDCDLVVRNSLGGWLIWQSRTRTSYGSVCALCLQRMHGLEV